MNQTVRCSRGTAQAKHCPVTVLLLALRLSLQLNQCLISAVCLFSVVSLFKKSEKCVKEKKSGRGEVFAHTGMRTDGWNRSAGKAVSPKFRRFNGESHSEGSERRICTLTCGKWGLFIVQHH